MEVDEKPSEEYSDIGGLDKQIQEVGSFLNVHVCVLAMVTIMFPAR